MLSRLGGEEEGEYRVCIGRVVGNKEPRAASGFFVESGGVFGLGENRDTAGAGAGGEVGGVVVEGIDEGDDGRVQRALR